MEEEAPGGSSHGVDEATVVSLPKLIIELEKICSPTTFPCSTFEVVQRSFEAEIKRLRAALATGRGPEELEGDQTTRSGGNLSLRRRGQLLLLCLDWLRRRRVGRLAHSLADPKVRWPEPWHRHAKEAFRVSSLSGFGFRACLSGFEPVFRVSSLSSCF